MNTRAGQLLFLVAATGLLSLLGWAMLGLDNFGSFAGAYGRILNHAAPDERHALNVVTAVIFDYRGFDTLGEESILFAAVIGASVLLRDEKAEERERKLIDENKGHGIDPSHSDLVRVVGPTAIGLTIVLGIYVVLHGHLSVGGGFQGGVIVSATWLLICLAGGSNVFYRMSRRFTVELAESLAVAAYALIGLAGMARGSQFLSNVLPLGAKGDLFSSGTIFAINIAVGIAVAAAFILLILEFIQPLERISQRRKQ